MSRQIIPDATNIESIIKKVRNLLSVPQATDGKVNISFKLEDNLNDEATVIFSDKAYAKMIALVSMFDSEVAWHGTVERKDNNTFLIKDIFVYPQQVTGVTVTTDQEEYSQWLYGLDDETFNSLKFQAHSHVNMGVSPSSTDISDQEKIVKQLESDMFYIFMIINKKNDIYISIYDYLNNIHYGTDDVYIRTESDDIMSFIEEAFDLVKKPTPLRDVMSYESKQRFDWSDYLDKYAD